MCLVRPARPDFLSRHTPSVGDTLGACFNRREIGSGIGLAHAQHEIIFAARNRRQKALLLLLAAIAQEARSALAVAEPMRRARCCNREHFLRDDEALEIRTLAPAITLRPCHTDPPAFSDAAREVGVEFRMSEVRPISRLREVGTQELPHFTLQLSGGGR